MLLIPRPFICGFMQPLKLILHNLFGYSQVSRRNFVKDRRLFPFVLQSLSILAELIAITIFSRITIKRVKDAYSYEQHHLLSLFVLSNLWVEHLM